MLDAQCCVRGCGKKRFCQSRILLSPVRKTALTSRLSQSFCRAKNRIVGHESPKPKSFIFFDLRDTNSTFGHVLHIYNGIATQIVFGHALHIYNGISNLGPQRDQKYIAGRNSSKRVTSPEST